MNDGLYLIENHVAYSKPKDCLRVLRDGCTWSSLSTDVPRAIEFRDGGELFAATCFEGPDGAEHRAPIERAGTWEDTAKGRTIVWRSWKEHLVPTQATRLAPEPVLQLPRGRIDDVLGLALQRRDGWEAVIDLDGRTEVRFPTVSDVDAAFARANDVVQTLRGGALATVMLDLATQVFDEYVDYMNGLDRPALPTASALATSLRVDTIALDEHGNATLWIGRVLGEHTVLAVLSSDCQSCKLGHP